MVDESGDIIETTLDESGEPVNEEIVGTVDDLPTEEEYTNEEGQTVRTVKEQRGPSSTSSSARTGAYST